MVGMKPTYEGLSYEFLFPTLMKNKLERNALNFISIFIPKTTRPSNYPYGIILFLYNKSQR